VRQESICALIDSNDAEKHKSVAHRILHNHEVAAAKASQATNKAL